jgi:hypothetical protein
VDDGAGRQGDEKIIGSPGWLERLASLGGTAEAAVGNAAVRLSARCHPERSRFSGVAKDLNLDQRRASAKLHHHPAVPPGCLSSPTVYNLWFSTLLQISL